MKRGMYRALVLALAMSLAALGALPAGAVESSGHHDGVWAGLVELISSLWQGDEKVIVTKTGSGVNELRADLGGADGELRSISAADGDKEPPPDDGRGTMDPDD